MSYAFIRERVAAFPIQVMCEVLGVSRSGYYAWASRPESARSAEDRAVAAEIRAAHGASRGRYGSPRVHAALHGHGRRVGRKRVACLMRGMGRSARRRRRFRRTTDSTQSFPVAPDLLGRGFTASAPSRVWLADLTPIWTAEGWLYLAVVLDLFSHRVVGWAMADHLGHQLALAALDDCRDNAPMESFYATLKGELVEQRDYLARDEARADVFQFLEGWCKRRRLHSALGYLTPEQTVAAFHAAASAAQCCP